MEKYFQGLREIAQIFGVSHTTLQSRGIAPDRTDPTRGILTIGPGTRGAISMPCLRIGGHWVVTSAALNSVLRALGAIAIEAASLGEPTATDAVAAPQRRRGRPRKHAAAGAGGAK